MSVDFLTVLQLSTTEQKKQFTYYFKMVFVATEFKASRLQIITTANYLNCNFEIFNIFF